MLLKSLEVWPRLVFYILSKRPKSLLVSKCQGFTSHPLFVGQWGNWVIQHVLEHGAPADRSYLLRVVARNLKEMAADQYASKVVEKAMRVAPRRELSEMVEACISCNGGRDGG